MARLEFDRTLAPEKDDTLTDGFTKRAIDCAKVGVSRTLPPLLGAAGFGANLDFVRHLRDECHDGAPHLRVTYFGESLSEFYGVGICQQLAGTADVAVVTYALK